jgi:hypothetical protein
MCLFEFIRVEGDTKFIKYFNGGGHAIKVWEPLGYKTYYCPPYDEISNMMLTLPQNVPE